MIVMAMGANLASKAGAPEDTLAAALETLQRRGIAILRVSSFYRTPAWPDETDPPFVNAVATIASALSPVALLQCLHAVEADYGRVRGIPNAPRTLDLDLVDYDGIVSDRPPILPHPRMTERAFVLVPLCEIAPDWRHPVGGACAADFVAALPAAARAGVVRIKSR